MTVARQAWPRRDVRVALEICAVAGLYYGAAELGLLQQLVRGQVTPLWPPSGIALASLLLLGPRVWPGIALGAFLVNVTLGPSAPAVLAIAAGNTLAPVCSYVLLRRAGFRNELNRLRDAQPLTGGRERDEVTDLGADFDDVGHGNWGTGNGESFKAVAVGSATRDSGIR